LLRIISIKFQNEENTISWSGLEPGNDVPQKVKEFYYFIMKIINSQN